MSYLVLARKYRPQTFHDVVGQAHVTQTLANAIVADRVPHAILFSGPRGTGKTTIARILAKAMNCKEGPTKTPCNTCQSCIEITSGNDVDVFEIDGASNNSVDQIRELRENIKYMPAHSRYKMYIIDEVHMLSVAAFNALLKTLEEPPPHIMFLFATTEPHKIPLTILSRCQRHDLRRIEIELIAGHLKELCQKEGALIDEEGLLTIAREAGGSMRDALSLLDQIMAGFDQDMTHDHLIDLLGIIDRRQIFDISNAVFQDNLPRILDILDQIYDRGHDVKQLYADIIAHFRNLLVVKMSQSSNRLVDLPKYEIEQLQQQVHNIPLTYLNQILDLLFQAEASIRFSDQPKLSLELVFFKLMQIKPALPIEELIEKLDMLRHELHSAGSSRETVRTSKDERPTVGLKPEKPKSMSKPSAKRPDEAATEEIDLNKSVPYKEVHDLEGTWEKVIDRIKRDYPSLAANLAQSSLKALTDETIEIEMNGNGFNTSMIKREKNFDILQRIFDDIFGRELKILIHEKKKQKRR